MKHFEQWQQIQTNVPYGFNCTFSLVRDSNIEVNIVSNYSKFLALLYGIDQLSVKAA